MKKILFLIIWLLTTFTLCYALEAHVSLERQVQDSDRIVRGRITNLSYRAGTNEFGDELIFTEVSIRVLEALKGDRSDLLLSVEGGILNGVRLEVSDVPEFKIGEDVLVFAKKELQTYGLSAGSQSKYTITKSGTFAENGQYYGTFKKTIMKAIHKPGGER